MAENKLLTAIELCKKLYNKTNNIFYYPALTGGTLYKEGDRKDIDLVFYSNRQKSTTKYELINSIYDIDNFVLLEVYANWIWKAKYKGINIDIFFPEDPKVYDLNQDDSRLKIEEKLQEFCEDNGIEFIEFDYEYGACFGVSVVDNHDYSDLLFELSPVIEEA